MPKFAKYNSTVVEQVLSNFSQELKAFRQGVSEFSKVSNFVLSTTSSSDLVNKVITSHHTPHIPITVGFHWAWIFGPAWPRTSLTGRKLHKHKFQASCPGRLYT
jgi:hypothetical protein